MFSDYFLKEYAIWDIARGLKCSGERGEAKGKRVRFQTGFSFAIVKAPDSSILNFPPTHNSLVSGDIRNGHGWVPGWLS